MNAVTIHSGRTVSALVPQTMAEAASLATAVVKAGMAPRGMETQEKCLIAILQGMEVGLKPMMAIQKIAIVNGRPTIWGDAVIGLVRGSGLCEYVEERTEGEGDALTAICETQRKGEKRPVTRSFSVADAKKAGLWGKQGPWQQFPARMLQMRARAFAMRDAYADVLGGMYLKEELDDAGTISAPVEHHAAPQIPSAPPVAQIAAPVADETDDASIRAWKAELEERADEECERGLEPYKAFWSSLNPTEQKAIFDGHENRKARAIAADQAFEKEDA